MPEFAITDIDDRDIDFFLQKALKKGRIEAINECTEQFVNKLHLIKSGYLTNAAALLFSKDPERWFTGAFIAEMRL